MVVIASVPFRPLDCFVARAPRNEDLFSLVAS